MKLKSTLLFVLIFELTLFKSQTGQVGINTTNPHPSAVFEVYSDTKGILIPRLTTAAINNLSSNAAEGLIVYDKDRKLFLGWDGSKWQNLGYEEQNTAPIASSVNISGTYQTGQTLSGNYSYSDADGDAENGTTYVWRRADSNSGTNALDISGATAQTYTQVVADQGKYLQFCVTPKSNTGASPGVQKCSSWGGPSSAAPVNQAPIVSAISISGNLNVNSTLTGTYSYNDNEGDTENTTASGSSFQWKIANDNSGTGAANATGTNNSGATNGSNKNYKLQASEAGKYIAYCVKPVANTGATTGTETCSSWSGPIDSKISGDVFNESFESGTANSYFTLNTTNPNASTGTVNSNSPAGWSPPSSPRSTTGSYGYQFSANNSSTGTAVFESPVINATQYTNNMTFSIRVAGFGSSSAQGLEVAANGDFVKIEISTDGGATYNATTATLGGNSNANWPFSTTGVVNVAYGSTFSQNQPNTGTNTTNDISTINITGIPNTSTQLRFKITIQNTQPSTTTEFWVVDDIKLVAP